MALGIYGRRFGPLFVLVVLAYAVVLAGMEIGRRLDVVQRAIGHVFIWFMEHGLVPKPQVVSLAWVPLAVLSAAIAIAVTARLRDEQVAWPRALARACRRAPVVIAVAFVVRIATLGIATTFQLLSTTTSGLFRMVGYNLIWIAMMSLVVTAVVVAAVERRGIVGSIVRGWRLADGARVRVFVLVLVAHVATTLLFVTLETLVIPDRSSNFELYGDLATALEILLAPIAPLVATVIYERLRIAKEGPAATQLERVFG